VGEEQRGVRRNWSIGSRYQLREHPRKNIYLNTSLEVGIEARGKKNRRREKRVHFLIGKRAISLNQTLLGGIIIALYKRKKGGRIRDVESQLSYLVREPRRKNRTGGIQFLRDNVERKERIGLEGKKNKSAIRRHEAARK